MTFWDFAGKNIDLIKTIMEGAGYLIAFALFVWWMK